MVVQRATAVVTGAGGGLGTAIASALTARGLLVHHTDLDPAAAERVAGPAGSWSALDVADGSACRALAQQIATEHGRLDVWVNNAGVLPTGPAWAMTDRQVEQTVAVNLTGLVHGTVAALQVMRRQGSGHVVNVVSLAGLIAGPGQALYAATKHGALAFSIGALVDLRVDGVRGVHVSALCPDGIWTPMLHDKVDDPWAAASWTGTMLQADEVALKAVGLLDRPRPVLAVPPVRGPLLRLGAALPSAYVRVAPLIMRGARRRQRAWGRTSARSVAPD